MLDKIKPISKNNIDIVKSNYYFDNNKDNNIINDVNKLGSVEELDFSNENNSTDSKEFGKKICELASKFGDKKVKYSDLKDGEKKVIAQLLKSQGYEKCFYNSDIEYINFDSFFEEEGYFEVNINLYSNDNGCRKFALESDFIKCIGYIENGAQTYYFRNKFNIEPNDIKYICNDDGKEKIILFDGTNIIFSGEYSKIEGIYDTNGNDILKKIDIFSKEAEKYGYYGGNQGSLINNFNNYYSDEIVRNILFKYFPNMDDNFNDDLKLLFAKMNNVGCGYITGINAVFEMTSSLSDDEFKEKFGFDRYKFDYTSDGEFIKVLNYDYMFLDYFLYYQTKYKSFSSIKDIYGNISEYAIDGALDKEKEIIGATGTYLDDVAKCLQRYLNDKDLSFDFDYWKYEDAKKSFFEYLLINDKSSFLNESSITANELYANYVKNQLNNGKIVVIGMDNFNMYASKDINNDGKINDIVKQKVRFHGMVITDVLDSGDFVVSSWGEKFIIKPDFDFSNFFNNSFSYYLGIYVPNHCSSLLIYDYNSNNNN